MLKILLLAPWQPKALFIFQLGFVVTAVLYDDKDKRHFPTGRKSTFYLKMPRIIRPSFKLSCPQLTY